MSDNESERSQREVDVPNVWAVTGDSNPYLHNFFSLFGIDPDGSQADYDYELDKASGLVDAGKISTAYGRPVNKSDVARGEDLAKTPVKFVAERLLAHSVHQLDVREFLPITRAIDKLRLDKPEDLLPLAVRDLSFLGPWLPEPSQLMSGGGSAVPKERLTEVFNPIPDEERILDL